MISLEKLSFLAIYSSAVVSAWLATYIVHSTLIIGGVALATRLRAPARAVQDVAWKLALISGVLTATIATLLRRLEKKGALTHIVEGRQFVYKASVTSDAVRRSRLSEVARRLLPADVPVLISHLLTSDKIGAEEIEQVKKLIAEKERKERQK